ncbi:hypothetical protein RU639_002341 [Aspergillus parasiticus]
MDESDPRLESCLSQPSSSPTQVPATVSLSRRLLQTAMTCLIQDEFFIRHKFSTFEALLMVIYNLSHNESVDQGWALLGMALNIGIALRCNVDQNSSPIETERRRRCWAGLLTLHTYQGMLFRDVDMSYLLNIEATPPADVNDADITDEGILPLSSRSEPTQMSVMMAKLRLFRLSSQICRHISGPSRLDQDLLHEFDAAIAEEQKQWDSTYLIDSSPNLLESNSYAYWQLYEAPLLRNYLWLLSGVTSLKALHAAVALYSCLQDTPSAVDPGYDFNSFRQDLESLIVCMKNTSSRSNICLRGYRILRHLQAQAGIENPLIRSPETELETLFENFTDIREWMDSDLINWNLDGAFNISTA